MHAPRWISAVLLAIGCGGSTPAAEPATPTAVAPAAEPAPAPTASPSASAPTSTTDASATGDKPTAAPVAEVPEFEATPSADLHALTKAQLGKAAKLVKEEQPWAEALAKVQGLLGPQTYVAHATDPQAPFGDTYYWTAAKRAGGCDSFYLQASADNQAVFEAGLKANAKGSTTLPDRGGPAIDPCSGQPAR